LDAYDILANSKAIIYFNNSPIVDKLLKLIENDQIPS